MIAPADRSGCPLLRRNHCMARWTSSLSMALMSAIRELIRCGSPCSVAYSPRASARESTRASSCNQWRSNWALAPQFVLSRPVGDQLVDQLYGFLLQLFGADAVSSGHS